MKSWLINVSCGLLAYTGSRFLWSHREMELGKLPLVQLDRVLMTERKGELKIHVLALGRSRGCFGRGLRLLLKPL